MLDKINVPANSERGLVAATIGAGRSDSKGMGFGVRCVIPHAIHKPE